MPSECLATATEKYGFRWDTDGRIQSPATPRLYGCTPCISLQPEADLPAKDLSFFYNALLQDSYPSPEDEKSLRSLVEGVFDFVTKQKVADYANIVFMSSADWNVFREIIHSNAEHGRTFNGITIEGQIIVCAKINQSLPLIFHELGHCLYPAIETFTDELRAYYFQRVCTEFLHKELEKVQVDYRYPDYYDERLFPSREHGLAYKAAQALYGYLSLPSEGEQSSPYTIRMQKYAKIVAGRQ